MCNNVMSDATFEVFFMLWCHQTRIHHQMQQMESRKGIFFNAAKICWLHVAVNTSSVLAQKIKKKLKI